MWLDGAGAVQAGVAAVGGVDEKLRFFDLVVSQLLCGAPIKTAIFLGLEEVVGKFAAGVLVVKELRVVKAPGEFRDNQVFVLGDAGVLRLHQSLRRPHHRGVCGLYRLLWPVTVQE